MGVTERPVRALFVNENIGGHATVHRHLRAVAATRSDIAVSVEDVPPPAFWRKAFGAALPGLATVDADLQPVRYQLAQSAWVARMLPRWLSAGSYDVVHLYTHNVGLLAGRALRGVPSVVTLDSTNAQSNLLHPVRELTRWSGLSLPVQRPFERATYLRADLVVANSRWAAASLREDYGVPADRVRVQPMGVPLHDPPAADCLGPQGLPRLVFVGYRLDRKGGLDLLEAHRRWLADRCELVLVTKDPVPPSHNLVVVSDALPGDGRVDALLRGALAFVFPSRIDQWPNAVMEAMAHGVVPVVSDVGGLPEMVLDGEAGVVMRSTGPEAVRDAVVGLLEDPARAARLAARAYRRVEEDLDVQITAARLLDHVRDVGAARRR